MHERFRATARAVLRGRNGAVSLLHDGEVDRPKLVYTFEDVEVGKKKREAVDTAINVERSA